MRSVVVLRDHVPRAGSRGEIIVPFAREEFAFLADSPGSDKHVDRRMTFHHT